jgi:hypothetical protein
MELLQFVPPHICQNLLNLAERCEGVSEYGQMKAPYLPHLGATCDPMFLSHFTEGTSKVTHKLLTDGEWDPG